MGGQGYARYKGWCDVRLTINALQTHLNIICYIPCFCMRLAVIGKTKYGNAATCVDPKLYTCDGERTDWKFIGGDLCKGDAAYDDRHCCSTGKTTMLPPGDGPSQLCT